MLYRLRTSVPSHHALAVFMMVTGLGACFENTKPAPHPTAPVKPAARRPLPPRAAEPPQHVDDAQRDELPKDPSASDSSTAPAPPHVKIPDVLRPDVPSPSEPHDESTVEEDEEAPADGASASDDVAPAPETVPPAEPEPADQTPVIANWELPSLADVPGLAEEAQLCAANGRWQPHLVSCICHDDTALFVTGVGCVSLDPWQEDEEGLLQSGNVTFAADYRLMEPTGSLWRRRPVTAQDVKNRHPASVLRGVTLAATDRTTISNTPWRHEAMLQGLSDAGLPAAQERRIVWTDPAVVSLPAACRSAMAAAGLSAVFCHTWFEMDKELNNGNGRSVRHPGASSGANNPVSLVQVMPGHDGGYPERVIRVAYEARLSGHDMQVDYILHLGGTLPYTRKLSISPRKLLPGHMDLWLAPTGEPVAIQLVDAAGQARWLDGKWCPVL